MIKDKKGFLRLVEAVIAIMLVLGVLVFISSNRKSNVESSLSEQIPPLLEEIAKDTTLREGIVTSEDAAIESKENEIKNFLNERVTNLLIGCDVEICEPINEALCPIQPAYPSDAEGEIFVSERVVSSILPQYAPKKVKIFLWMRETPEDMSCS